MPLLGLLNETRIILIQHDFVEATPAPPVVLDMVIPLVVKVGVVDRLEMAQGVAEFAIQRLDGLLQRFQPGEDIAQFVLPAF